MSRRFHENRLFVALYCCDICGVYLIVFMRKHSCHTRYCLKIVRLKLDVLDDAHR